MRPGESPAPIDGEGPRLLPPYRARSGARPHGPACARPSLASDRAHAQGSADPLLTGHELYDRLGRTAAAARMRTARCSAPHATKSC
jgi:hypothetical protein